MRCHQSGWRRVPGRLVSDATSRKGKRANRHVRSLAAAADEILGHSLFAFGIGTASAAGGGPIGTRTHVVTGTRSVTTSATVLHVVTCTLRVRVSSLHSSTRVL